MDKAEFMETLAATTRMRQETKEKRGRRRLYWSVMQSRGGALIGVGVPARSAQLKYFTPLTAVADEIQPGQWGRAYEELFNNEDIDETANALQMVPELAARIREASRFAPENNESDEIHQLRYELLCNTKALTYENIEDLRAHIQQ